MLDDTKPVWHDWQWLDPVVRPGIEDQFDCLNDSENNNWISYPNSKYAESAFLPAEEWRKQIGWNWGNVGSMSIDGLTVPTSTQFRRTIGACIRIYCNDSQFKTKAACSADFGQSGFTRDDTTFNYLSTAGIDNPTIKDPSAYFQTTL